MPTMSDEQYREEVDAGYRAIGRYVVEFSRLVARMRDVAGWQLAGGIHGDPMIGRLVLGEANASQIADAFFGLCRALGDLDPDEQKVSVALRGEVKKAIEKRNDVAHGDWWPGIIADDEESVAPSELVRYRPVRSEGVEKRERLTARELDDLAESLATLRQLVHEFGVLALRLMTWKRGPKRALTVVKKDGKYRVRDVLVWDGGQVTRTGPYAQETPRIMC